MYVQQQPANVRGVLGRFPAAAATKRISDASDNDGEAANASTAGRSKKRVSDASHAAANASTTGHALTPGRSKKRVSDVSNAAASASTTGHALTPGRPPALRHQSMFGRASRFSSARLSDEDVAVLARRRSGDGGETGRRSLEAEPHDLFCCAFGQLCQDKQYRLFLILGAVAILLVVTAVVLTFVVSRKRDIDEDEIDN